MSESSASPEGSAESPPERRVLAILLAVLAAGALIAACVLPSWLYNPRTRGQVEVGFGLISNFECSDGTCRSMSNSELVASYTKQLDEIRREAGRAVDDLQIQAFAAGAAEELRAPAPFPILGWITLVSLGLAAAALVVCVGLVVAKKRIQWPLMPTTVAILGVGIGLITGCIFVALKPGPPGFVGVHTGFFLFGAGTIIGLAAALMINKLLRPHDPDLLADSMDPEHY